MGSKIKTFANPRIALALAAALSSAGCSTYSFVRDDISTTGVRTSGVNLPLLGGIAVPRADAATLENNEADGALASPHRTLNRVGQHVVCNMDGEAGNLRRDRTEVDTAEDRLLGRPVANPCQGIRGIRSPRP